jgi:glycosyltransferase involved in cell wall biosynthesis
MVTYCISRELAKRGHSVIVYTSDMKDKYTRLNSGAEEIDGVRVYRFRSIGTMLTRDMQVFVTPDIIPSLKDEGDSFDIVHIHEYRSFQNIFVHRYARKYGVPYVLNAHGSLPRIMAKRRLKWIYDIFFGYRLLRDASKVIAEGQEEAEQYKAMGVREEKIVVISNGIDLSEFSDLPPKGCFKKKFNIPEDKKIILYLGRIHKIKGIDFLVKAYAHLTKSMNFNDAILVIAGPDDGYLRETQALINSLKIDDIVLLTGPLYGRDKLEAYIDADVYVLPSRYENWGLTALEAVACGTPVILTENCGAAKYFKDKVGLVVKPDSSHLAEALLEMFLSQDKRELFRENGRTLIEKFSISEVVSELEKVYEEVRSSGRT